MTNEGLTTKNPKFSTKNPKFRQMNHFLEGFVRPFVFFVVKNGRKFLTYSKFHSY
jgi:hypothetical protein